MAINKLKIEKKCVTDYLFIDDYFKVEYLVMKKFFKNTIL